MNHRITQTIYVLLAVATTYVILIEFAIITVVPLDKKPVFKTSSINLPEKERKYPTQFLDGCKDVFIDVGANIGVHGRKVFDNSSYPCIMQEYFDQYFGPNRSEVCVVGFEINPIHTLRLNTLTECYTRINRKMFYFTQVAVSNTDNMLVNASAMEEVYGGERNNYWGTRIITNARNDSFQVNTINLARFVKTYVRDRKLPVGVSKGNVVMKMDIEGAEFAVMSGLLAQGALCDSIDLITIEWHGSHVLKDYVSRLADMPSSLFGCKMPTVLKVDDESFLRDGIHRPIECNDIDIPYAPKKN
jgi:Methyltransferase FkbM domain